MKMKQYLEGCIENFSFCVIILEVIILEIKFWFKNFIHKMHLHKICVCIPICSTKNNDYCKLIFSEHNSALFFHNSLLYLFPLQNLPILIASAVFLFLSHVLKKYNILVKFIDIMFSTYNNMGTIYRGNERNPWIIVIYNRISLIQT